MSKRGLVLEVQTHQVTVLCPGGEFREVPRDQSLPQVGSEIALPSDKRSPWLGLMAAVLLLFTLGQVLWGGLAPTQAQPASYVGIDINPSVEFYLDGSNRVLDAQGVNAQGLELLARDDFSGLPLEDAIYLLVDRAADEGYVDPEQSNLFLLATVGLGEEATPPPLEPAAQAMEGALAVGTEAVVAVQEASREDLDRAQSEQISLNAFLLSKRYEMRGEALSLDDLRSISVAELLEKMGIAPEEFLAEGFRSLETEEERGWNKTRMVDEGEHGLLLMESANGAIPQGGENEGQERETNGSKTSEGNTGSNGAPGSNGDNSNGNGSRNKPTGSGTQNGSNPGSSSSSGRQPPAAPKAPPAVDEPDKTPASEPVEPEPAGEGKEQLPAGDNGETPPVEPGGEPDGKPDAVEEENNGIYRSSFPAAPHNPGIEVP